MTKSKTKEYQYTVNAAGLCWPDSNPDIKKYGAPVTEEVKLCADWLSEHGEKRERFNLNIRSYGLKHVVENEVSQYISNGAFIRAALDLGYKIIHAPKDLNCYFNLKIKGRHWSYNPLPSDGSDYNQEDDVEKEDEDDYQFRMRSKADPDWSKRQWKLVYDVLTNGKEITYNFEEFMLSVSPRYYQKFPEAWQLVAANAFTVINKLLYYSPNRNYFLGQAWGYAACSIYVDLLDDNTKYDKITQESGKHSEILKRLPIALREPNHFNGSSSFEFPKIKEAIEYMNTKAFFEDVWALREEPK